MFEPDKFFDLRTPELRSLFSDISEAWELIDVLPEVLARLLGGRRIIRGTVMDGAVIGDGPLFVGEGTVIEPGAIVEGPVYLGRSVSIRGGASVGGNCLLLGGSMVGPASEVRNSVFLPRAKAPHLAQVGESVLGHDVVLGTGTRLSRTPAEGSTRSDGFRRAARAKSADTGRRRFGAVLGDRVRTGPNVVVQPGVLIGKGSFVYPNLSIPQGFHAANSILKLKQDWDSAERR